MIGVWCEGDSGFKPDRFESNLPRAFKELGWKVVDLQKDGGKLKFVWVIEDEFSRFNPTPYGAPCLYYGTAGMRLHEIHKANAMRGFYKGHFLHSILEQKFLPKTQWLRYCAFPEDYPQNLPRRQKVVMIGRYYDRRKMVAVQMRKELGEDFEFHGYIEPYSEYTSMLATNQIIIIVGGLSDVVFDWCGGTQPLMDAAAAGVCILTEKFPYLEANFDIGTELETWCNIPELVWKCRTLLKDPDRCRNIGLAARQRVIREHHAHIRAKEVLDYWRAL